MEREYNSCDLHHSLLIEATDWKRWLPENVHSGPKYDKSNIKMYGFILVMVEEISSFWIGGII